MAPASAIFFLIVALVGGGDAGAFTTLGTYQSAAACGTASSAIQAALGQGRSSAKVFCVPASAMEGLGRGIAGK